MKKMILVALVGFLSIGLSAQGVFNKGVLMFNAGVGGPSNFGAIPSVNFSGEVGVIPTGTIGVVSFGGLAEFHIGTFGGDPFPRFYIGPRAAWHFLGLNTNVFDVYAGAGFGIGFNGKNDFRNANTTVYPDAFVGGRWMFGGAMGLFAELGSTGLSFAKFGITFGL
ncbi:MAG: hypothetical protein C0598_09595 [Marinilabiliales bacterium]|nr:MAG: hypothetical protein C0598_09595 [Marinilabiliales bacterium]